MIDYALLKRQAELTQSLGTVRSRTTAYGQRLKDLSRAYHFHLLADEVIVEYLDELAHSAESLLCEVEDLEVNEVQVDERRDLLTYLEGVLELSDLLDRVPYEEFVAQVDRLDTRAVAVMVRTSLKAAA